MKWRERGTHLNNCFWFSFLPPPHQVDDVRFIRTRERYSRAWATHSQPRKIPYYPESKPFAILPTVGKGTRTFSRPPRGRSPRAFHAPSSSMPVGRSSHYDVARWKMLGGTDHLLLHGGENSLRIASSVIPGARKIFLAAVTRIFACICLVAWKYLLCQRTALRV